MFLVVIFIKFILWGFQNRFCLIPNPGIIDFIDNWSFCILKSKLRFCGMRNMVLKWINSPLECWLFACKDVFFILEYPSTQMYNFWKNIKKLKPHWKVQMGKQEERVLKRMILTIGCWFLVCRDIFFHFEMSNSSQV